MKRRPQQRPAGSPGWVPRKHAWVLAACVTKLHCHLLPCGARIKDSNGEEAAAATREKLRVEGRQVLMGNFNGSRREVAVPRCSTACPR